jgi:hypothetical protein
MRLFGDYRSLNGQRVDTPFYCRKSLNGNTCECVKTHAASFDLDLIDCSDAVVDVSQDAMVRNTISNAAVVISAPGMVTMRPYGVPSLFGMSDPKASMIGPKHAHAENVAFIRFDIMGFPRTIG